MQRAFLSRFTLVLLLAACVVAAAIGGAPPLPAGAQSLDPTPTATPRADERPDRCEPNNEMKRSCRLDLDAASGPFTFLPEGDVDFYSVMLGEQPDGMETTITIRATGGLDLYTTVRQPEGGSPIATIASPAISTTLAADVTGWVVLRVENRGAAIATGQSYRVEVRRTLPPTPAVPTPTPTGPEGLQRQPAQPDALENNWSPDTASPIGVGVLYDLTFVCPVTGGCSGGDHDFLRVDVKRGMRYLLSTFDLAPGVDTVMELLWWSPSNGWQVLAANDDERPGAAFLSTLRWQAPGDGQAIVHIGPRSGGLDPILGDGQPTYRFALALADSPLAAQLEERIAIQTNAPTPSPVALPTEAAGEDGGNGGSAAPPSVEPTPISIEEGGATGQAMVIAAAEAHTAPDGSSPALGTIPVDAIVTLTGRTAGLWAEITSGEIVGSSWVDRRMLRPTAATAPTASAGLPGEIGGTLPGEPGTAPVSSNGDVVAAVTDAPALPIEPVASLPERVPAEANVSLLQGTTPLRGIRVLLVTVFDDVLSEQVTTDDGTAIFNVPVTAGTALFVVIPELGVRERVSADNSTISIVLPEVTP